MTEANSSLGITTQADELILLEILRDYALELQARGEAFLFGSEKDAQLEKIREEQWAEVWKRFTAKTHITNRPPELTVLVILAINKFREDDDFPCLPCSRKPCFCIAYQETTLKMCRCKHEKRFHNKMSPLKQEQFPQILEYIHQCTRPWSKAETIELFSTAENFDPKTFNRSMNGCIQHWTEVVSMIFKEKGRPIEISIEDLITKFHEDSGNTEGVSGSQTFGKTEATNMIIQYLRDKKALDSGINRPLKECEAYFRKLLAWIAGKRGQSLKELCSDAIATYHEPANLDALKEEEKSKDL